MAWWRSATHLALGALLAAVVLRLLFSLRLVLWQLLRVFRSMEENLHPCQSYKIPKYNESLQENPLYRKATTFISTLPSLHDSTDALLFSSSHSPSDVFLQLAPNQTVHDVFLGAKISWTHLAPDLLLLRLRKEDRRRVLRPYLQHIQSVAGEVELTRMDVRLFINSDDEGRRRWKSVPFTHPSTMDTLAMDPDLKSRVVADLDSFLKNKNYYHRLGRVWKRSYLLHGPPGTGKSSFIAAMAKYLSYDVYDLDLTRVSDGSDLKTLLLQTSPKSVIVVEDLDKHLPNLPDLLNLMDGLFSCCGEERLMVFTMRDLMGTTKENGLDPALLRPGRLDVHLHFPLCDFTAFKAMASSYLGLKDHKLYPAVEEIFQSGAASISPAEIGEIMIANRGSPSRALKTVISALQQSGAAAKKFGLALGVHKKKNSEGGMANDGAVGRCGEEEDDERGVASDCNGVLGSNGTLNKEIRKLYGLIKRGGSRREFAGVPPLLPPVTNVSGDLERHSRELSV